MNWRLILLLSLLGLAHAVAIVYGYPARIAGPTWLVLWSICAVVIARRAPGNYFWHGFGVGLMNWVWVSGSHIVLFDAYVARHASEVAAMRAMPPLTLPVIGPMVAALRYYDAPIPGASAVLIGLLTWLASRFLRHKRS